MDRCSTGHQGSLVSIIGDQWVGELAVAAGSLASSHNTSPAFHEEREEETEKDQETQSTHHKNPGTNGGGLSLVIGLWFHI